MLSQLDADVPTKVEPVTVAVVQLSPSSLLVAIASPPGDPFGTYTVPSGPTAPLVG